MDRYCGCQLMIILRLIQFTKCVNLNLAEINFFQRSRKLFNSEFRWEQHFKKFWRVLGRIPMQVGSKTF